MSGAVLTSEMHLKSGPKASNAAAFSVLSLVLHASVFFVLGVLPKRLAELIVRPNAEVAIVVEEPPTVEAAPIAPEPEPEPVAPAPEPEPVRAEPAPRVVDRAPPPPAAPNTPAPPPAAEVVDFDNLNLTNDNSNAGWAISAGTGQAAEGPMRNMGRGLISDRNVAGRPGGVRGGTGDTPGAAPVVVAASNLSRRPRPPATLDEELLRNYPQAAREQEIEGETVAKVTIGPDGSIGPVRIVRGGENGFGAACRQTLTRAGRWTPPLDASGNPVTSEIEFTCAFEVRR